MIIRSVTSKDKKELYALYKQVAKNPRGIARAEDEISEAYIDEALDAVQKQGIMLVGIDEVSEKLVAGIHAKKYGVKIFEHILTNLTVMVHPDFQSRGLGRKIFQSFLAEVVKNWPKIARIELESRASNQKSISFYRGLGFKQEGILKNKVKNKDGSFEDGISMAWIKPGFEFGHAEQNKVETV